MSSIDPVGTGKEEVQEVQWVDGEFERLEQRLMAGFREAGMSVNRRNYCYVVTGQSVEGYKPQFTLEPGIAETSSGDRKTIMVYGGGVVCPNGDVISSSDGSPYFSKASSILPNQVLPVYRAVLGEKSPRLEIFP